MGPRVPAKDGLLGAGGAGDVVLIPRQGWSLRRGDFLLTRMLEIVVHADDLAASFGIPTPSWPSKVFDPFPTARPPGRAPARPVCGHQCAVPARAREQHRCLLTTPSRSPIVARDAGKGIAQGGPRHARYAGPATTL